MDGIINLNKPQGITSRKAVSEAQRILRVRKAGHAGTLDPMATGVLLVCIGEAVKIVRFLSDMEKRYRACLKLGERTNTYDADGTIVERRDISALTADSVAAVIEGFRGTIKQTPPMFSAVKQGGRPLYKLARKGIEVERVSRTVEIIEIKVIDVRLPFAEIAVTCSKGTYIRTLCDDIGQVLGTGAHLVALERTGIGPFDIGGAQPLGAVSSMYPVVHAIDTALSGLPSVELDGFRLARARNGGRISGEGFEDIPDDVHVRLKDHRGNLFGIGRVTFPFIVVERILHLDGAINAKSD